MTTDAIDTAGLDAALAAIQAEDARQDKLHDLLETIREQIRVQVAPEDRPHGLMQNIQNAVYAMRGRTQLMNDARITAYLEATRTTHEPVAWQHRGKSAGQREFGPWRDGRNQSFDTADGDMFEERPLFALPTQQGFEEGVNSREDVSGDQVLAVAGRIQAILSEYLTAEDGEIMMVGPASYKIARLFKPVPAPSTASGELEPVLRGLREILSDFDNDVADEMANENGERADLWVNAEFPVEAVRAVVAALSAVPASPVPKPEGGGE